MQALLERSRLARLAARKQMQCAFFVQALQGISCAKAMMSEVDTI